VKILGSVGFVLIPKPHTLYTLYTIYALYTLYALRCYVAKKGVRVIYIE
jgi:hypothetical protein